MRKLILITLSLILIGAGCGKGTPSSKTGTQTANDEKDSASGSLCPSIKQIKQTCGTGANPYLNETVGRNNDAAGFQLECTYGVSGALTFFSIHVLDLDTSQAIQDEYAHQTEDMLLNKKITAQNEIGIKSVRGIDLDNSHRMVIAASDLRLVDIRHIAEKENNSICDEDKFTEVAKSLSQIKPGAVSQAAKEKFSLKECTDIAKKAEEATGGFKEFGATGEANDSCYRQQAIYASDVTLCEQISNEGRKNEFGTNEYDECLMSFIRSSKDKSLCAKMFLPKNRKTCYLRLAHELQDANVCNLASPDDFSPSERELCITEIAIKLNDPKVCNIMRPEDEDAYVAGDKVHKKECLDALKPKE